VGVGALGFSRVASAQTDPSTWVIQTAKFGVGAEKVEEAKAMLKELATAVEEKEPGVLTYIAHLTSTDPKSVFFYEIYANAEALAAHGQTEHIGKLRAAFGTGVLLPPAEIVRLDHVAGFQR
jgi:quinol monooxygenase YgiN